ncbi:AAA family ATPase [Magnetospirillum molischianum]|nr:AAA family ATPase [Magnetospirillum molischianum]
MGILNFQPATRAGARLLIQFYGGSESGKTLSALKLMAGMEADPSKRVLIDTEAGRGRLYCDAIAGGYVYAELTPPFSPERYIAALDEVEKAGFTVAVFDSLSHLWGGDGGVLDIADNNGSKGVAKWKDPKARLEKVKRRLLTSRCHLIFCTRAKQPMKEVEVNGRKEWVRQDEWVEQFDKSWRFELTLVLQMVGRGHFLHEYPKGKVPDALKPIVEGIDLINEDAGRKLAAWVSGGEIITPAQQALRVQAEEEARKGRAALTAWWKVQTKDTHAFLRTVSENLGSIARSADEERERLDRLRQQQERDADPQSLSDPFGAGGMQKIGTLSSEAAAGLAQMQAAATEAEVDAVWEALDLEVCRELGSGALDEQRARVNGEG